LHLLAEKRLRCETVESQGDRLVENLRMIEEKKEKFRPLGAQIARRERHRQGVGARHGPTRLGNLRTLVV